jgi:hypothetical protein
MLQSHCHENFKSHTAKVSDEVHIFTQLAVKKKKAKKKKKKKKKKKNWGVGQHQGNLILEVWTSDLE